MQQSGLITGLFVYEYRGTGHHPARLYINDGVVPVPEIHQEEYGGGESSNTKTMTWGYGYAFVSKGDVLSVKQYYYGLQESCTTYNSTISFVPTRKK